MAELRDVSADRPAVVERDSWLAPYEDAVRWRRARFYERLAELTADFDGRLSELANGHHYFGFHKVDSRPAAFAYREWAPAATALYLIGDFNGWNRQAHPLRPVGGGAWELTLPWAEGPRHGSRLKVHVVSARGGEDRIPLYATRVVQDPESKDFAAELWLPSEPYSWRQASVAVDGPPLIYEAHVGMAQEAESVGSFRDFADTVLPRVAAGGYNALQLMGIAEHPYYGSFGYHVSSLFAPSSRFGTPDDLKYLIDTAHGLGLAVYMDLVHSHAVKNTREGMAGFDGTDYQLFHTGPRGEHPAWDSKLYDYGRPGVSHFLLSNLKYWLEEFRVDGFRFDGVTSMLYLHHGLGTAFDHYDKYFLTGIDVDAVTYLQLANRLVREVRPDAVTIAEDVSGMPGIAAPVEDGGLGFDFRLAMGLPDYWFHLVKTRRDEDWRPSEILAALANRRSGEKHVAYVESHDQSLVGDKTLAFTLMDSAMYWHMGVDDKDAVVARGIALHKMIRLLTLAAGGEAWLTFMGNEFGHPDWVDFPRAGNDWSHKYARRQWSLADAPGLQYRFLLAFDRAMLALEREHRFLAAEPAETLLVDDEGKLLVLQRGGLIFAANFHPHASRPGLVVPSPSSSSGHGSYQVALDSDDREFGGHGLVDHSVVHDSDGTSLTIYLPARTIIVYRKR